MYLKCSAGFLLCSLSSLACADSIYHSNNFYVAPSVAYYHFSEKRDLQNTAMANLSAGWAISEQFTVEAFYGQAATNRAATTINQGARFYSYLADGVYHFSPGTVATFHPYALAGLGITTQQESNNVIGNTTLLNVNVGVGIEYFVNRSISLFSDVRDIYTLSGGKNDWMLNAGIKFLFDEKESAAKIIESEPSPKTDGTVGFYQLQEEAE